jgi:hypothetical protein
MEDWLTRLWPFRPGSHAILGIGMFRGLAVLIKLTLAREDFVRFLFEKPMFYAVAVRTKALQIV